MNETAAGVAVDQRIWSSSFISRLAAFARTHRRQIELVLAVAIYLGFACYLTWPLVTNLTHSIYGAPGDPYGTISFYRELVAHHLNPFLPGTISQLSAPEGQPIPWPLDLASAPEVLAWYLLTVFFGAISAYGLYTLAGYTLTGVVTFLFARRLTSNTWAALIAGWAYAFYPFAVINGQGHLDFVHGWVLVLAIWRMVELLWYPTRRNGLLAGLAVVLAMWWSPYFILFAVVAYVTVAVATLVIAWFDGAIRATLLPQAITASIVTVFSGLLAILSSAGATEGIGVRTRSVRDLYVYAARPLQYLLPDAQSPLFGGVTRHYLETHTYGSGPVEDTLYVGAIVLLLALVATAAYGLRRLSPALGRAVLVLALVALAAAVTSMPPEVRIAGQKIPFPSHFISQVTETWRVYSRFVIVVMLGLSVLAAVGLDVLTRKRRPWVKVGIMSLATIVIPLDLWAHQSGHVTTLSTPNIYRTLARQPMGAVAEYPLGTPGFNAYSDMFYQGAYNKPLLNGYLEGSFQELRAFSLADLANPSTAPRLATLGVRYVLVDLTPPGSPSAVGWSSPATPGAGFHLIAQEPYADLYVVTARPQSSVLPTAGTGFIAAEVNGRGSIVALNKPSGTIELTGSCTSCDGVLSMTLAPYGQAREVMIFDSNGHTLERISVTRPTKIAVPLRFGRRTTLTLTATPGPQPVGETPGAPSASILMNTPEFVDTVRRGGLASHDNPTGGQAR